MTLKELFKKDKKEVDTKEGEITYACRFYQPNVDILENDSEIVLYADIPGVNKEDVEVTVENNTLKLSAKIDPSEYRDLKPLYTEYGLGHFTREFKLGGKIDKDSIVANIDNGVLSLKLKKSQEVLPRRIEIH